MTETDAQQQPNQKNKENRTKRPTNKQKQEKNEVPKRTTRHASTSCGRMNMRQLALWIAIFVFVACNIVMMASSNGMISQWAEDSVAAMMPSLSGAPSEYHRIEPVFETTHDFRMDGPRQQRGTFEALPITNDGLFEFMEDTMQALGMAGSPDAASNPTRSGMLRGGTRSSMPGATFATSSSVANSSNSSNSTRSDNSSNATIVVDTIHSFSGVCAEQKSSGQAYAAAWMCSVNTLLQNSRLQEENLYDPTRKYNLEAGVFAVMSGVQKLYSTIDMFDFMVHHLSNYAKIEGFHGGRGPVVMDETTRRTQEMIVDYTELGYNNPSNIRADNVLVILPYYASETARAKTSKSHRQLFLELIVKTMSNIFPNIVVFTATQSDFDYVVDADTGLNEYLYDVQLIPDLVHPTWLPIGSSIRTRTLFLNGTYSQDDFQYVYYTEPDQILHVRNVEHILGVLADEPRNGTVIAPHRGQPYPRWEDFDVDNANVTTGLPRGLKKFLGATTPLPMLDVPNLLTSSCCFSRPCQQKKDRSMHKPSSTFPLFRQHMSLAHITGTGNIFKEEYIQCNFSDVRVEC